MVVDAASKGFRRGLVIVAAMAWAVAILVLVLAVGFVEMGQRGSHHMGLLFSLAIAVTTTIVGLVGGVQAPVETAFRLGYDSGFAEGHKHARPVLVPGAVMRQHRRHSDPHIEGDDDEEDLGGSRPDALRRV